MNEIKIWQKLQFPDGDIATIIRIDEYKDEEGDKGFYDMKTAVYTVDGDEDKMEFEENLDSRDDYKFHVMKPIYPSTK